jgi:hypothetical protein
MRLCVGDREKKMVVVSSLWPILFGQHLRDLARPESRGCPTEGLVGFSRRNFPLPFPKAELCHSRSPEKARGVGFRCENRAFVSVPLEYEITRWGVW